MTGIHRHGQRRAIQLRIEQLDTTLELDGVGRVAPGPFRELARAL
jgi:hypothetical protein